MLRIQAQYECSTSFVWRWTILSNWPALGRSQMALMSHSRAAPQRSTTFFLRQTSQSPNWQIQRCNRNSLEAKGWAPEPADQEMALEREFFVVVVVLSLDKHVARERSTTTALEQTSLPSSSRSPRCSRRAARS